MINFKGAIFDLDGTLLNSMPIWETVASDFLVKQGITPGAEVNEAVRSMSIQQVCALFCSEYGLPLSNEDIIDGINKMVEDFYFHQVPLKSGVAEALARLKNRGVKMCVATATDRYLVEAALRRNKVLQYFDRIFTCTEVGAGKDQPDIYLRALDALGTDLADTVVFEDALYAIRTAKETGFIVAALYDTSADEKQNAIKKLADYYFTSFVEWNKRDA
jgi:HAD superfamily hydrolase (TIGR01509 family)